MKISKSFLIMFILWVIGFTDILGGPYLFFKIIFWIAFLPFIISAMLFLLVFLKIKKTVHSNTSQNTERETLHVDAVIKE